jgi:hypothetical protein
MRRIIFALFAFALMPLAAAAQTATSDEVQGLIASGNDSQAASQLTTILAQHPESAKAWYLQAEVQDAMGHEDNARTALAHAQSLAPNMPFADPQKLAALRDHIGQAHIGQAHHSGGIPMFLIIIVGFVALFVILRMFGRRRGLGGGPVYRDGFNAPPPMGGQPYGYGQPGYGQTMGGGIGSSIVSGLAAGAGVALGERAVEDMFGNRGGDNQGQNFGGDQGRDDGLLGGGDQSWDNGGNDQNNNDGGW